ncbi:MAG: oligopeptidase A, partial [Betaproteobacteria bacterium]
MNPLLDFSGLPRFAEFKPEIVTPALDQLLSENRALVTALGNPDSPADWGNFIAPLDDGNERLRRAWGQVSHLNAVMNSPQLRDVYNANLPRITQYFTELAQDEALYCKYKALRT